MKCVKCGSAETKLDQYTSMYFCKHCNTIFSSDDTRDIGLFTNILLGALINIPIVNMIVLVILDKLSVRREYLKTYVAMFCLNSLIIAGISLTFAYMVNVKRAEMKPITNDDIDNVLSNVVTIIDGTSYDNVVETEKVEEEIIPIEPETESATIEETFDKFDTTRETIQLLDNSKVKGSSVKLILSLFENEDFTVIIRTMGMKNKYGRFCEYKLWGNVLKGCAPDNSHNISITIDDNNKVNYKSSWILNEDGKCIKEDYADYTDKKYISYVRDLDYYLMNAIYDDTSNEVIGVILDCE